MAASLKDTIRANRFDVFRHTLRSIALASAAASGLALGGPLGCAESHLVGDSDASVTAPWTPTCAPGGQAVVLDGLTLPEGSEGLVVVDYTVYGWGVELAYVAGDGCPSPDRPCGWEGMARAPGARYAVFLRQGDTLTPTTPRDVVGTRVGSPQAAALLALEAGYRVQCEGSEYGGGTVTRVSGGYEVTGVRRTSCEEDISSPPVFAGTVRVTDSGDVRVIEESVVGETTCAVIGRLTAGTNTLPRAQHGERAGRYFAHVSQLEAAAVDAFERMAEELHALGAPQPLVAWASTSAEDERRHARSMGALAEHFAVTPAGHRSQRFPLRELFDVALENAREGCVRETYGAIVAHHQAAFAADAVVREAMRAVAEDETRHAALSWTVAEWAASQLGNDERAALTRVQREAFDELLREVAQPEAPLLRSETGLPAPDAARAMVLALRDAVLA